MMDYHNLKRKELQQLCKKHAIPANLTNLEMATRLSSLLKVNDEKPLTRGRSCLKILDNENVNEREADVVNKNAKKVKFSPEIEMFEFTKSVKKGGRRKSMLPKNGLDVANDGVKAGILDTPVRATRSQRIKLNDVEEKDSTDLVNESKDEIGVSTRRSLKNKEVVVSENEGDVKLVETKAKETNRGRRRKSMAHTQALRVQNEVGAEVREEVAEKPARVTRPRKAKQVEDDANNKSSPTKEVEVQVITRSSQQNSVVEAPQEALKRSQRLAEKAGSARLLDNISEDKMVTRGRTKIQSNLIVESSILEKEMKINEPQANLEVVNHLEKPVEAAVRRSYRRKSVVPCVEKLRFEKEPAEVPIRRSDRRKSVVPSLEKLRFGKEPVEAPVRRSDRRKSVVPSLEKLRFGKEPVEAPVRRSDRRKSVVPSLEKLRFEKEPVEAPVRRSDRRKSVVPSLKKLRSDEVEVVKEKRKFSNANDNKIRNKGTKTKHQKILKRSKQLPTQVEDSVLAKDDIAETEVFVKGRTARTEPQGTLEAVPHLNEEPARSRTTEGQEITTDEQKFRNSNENDCEYLEDWDNGPDEGVRSAEFEATDGQEITTADELQFRNINDIECEYLENRENGPDEGVKSAESEAIKEQEIITDQWQIRHNNGNECEYLDDQENGPDEGVRSAEFEATEGQEITTDEQQFRNDNECEYLEDQENGPDEDMQQLSHFNDSKNSLEAAASEKTFSSSIQEVLDFPEPAVLGDGITLHIIPLVDNDEEKQEEKKDYLESGSKLKENEVILDEEIKVPECGGHAFPSAGNDLTQSVTPLKDTSEDDDAGEELKGLFATPFFVSQSTGGQPFHVQSQLSEEATTMGEMHGCSGIQNLIKSTDEETTSTKPKCTQDHEMRTLNSSGMERILSECKDGSAGVNQASPSAGNDLTQSVTPLKDTSEDDDAGEELKGLFATPFFVSLSTGSQPFHVQSQLNEEATTMGEILGCSGIQNLSESVSVSVKSTDEATTSTKPKFTQDHEMRTLNSSRMERIVSECKDGSAGVSQAAPSSNGLGHSVTPLKDTSEDEEAGEELKCLFATPFFVSQSLRGHSSILQSQLTAKAMSMRDGLGSSAGKDSCMIEDEQAPETSHITAVNYNVENEQASPFAGNDLAQSVTPLKDASEDDDAGEELKGLFATPFFVSKSIGVRPSHLHCQLNGEEATLGAGLGSSGIENLSEYVNGEQQSVSFTSPGTVEKADEEITSTKAKHSQDHEMGTFNCCRVERNLGEKDGSDGVNKASPSAGNDLTQSVTLSKDRSEDDDAGEELKGLFATPFFVSQSTGSQPFHVQSQLSEEAMTMGEILGCSEIQNLSESVSVSVKSTDEATTSTKPKCTQDHEMRTLNSSRMERIVSECKDGSAGVSQASTSVGNDWTQSATPLMDTSEDDEAGEELKGLFATPFFGSQSIGMGPGSSGKENLSEGTGLIEDLQGEQLRSLFTSPVFVQTALEETISTGQLKTAMITSASEMKGFDFSGEPLTVEIIDGCSDCTKGSCFHRNEEQVKGRVLFATPPKGTSLLQLEESDLGDCEDGSAGATQASKTSHIISFNCGDENEQVDQPILLFGSPINIVSLDQENERSGRMVDAVDLSEPERTGFKYIEEQMKVEKIKETLECMNASGALEDENIEVQGSLLSTASAKNTTPLQKDEFSRQEPKTTYVAMTEEMVRDTEMNTRLESIDIKELESEEAMADRDLLPRDTSKKMVIEINKSNPESIEPSDAFNEENTEDHLKLLFATPIKGTNSSRIDEGSICQLKTTMIAEFALSTEGVNSKDRNKHQGSPMGTKEAKESCESSKDRKALELIESSLLSEEDYRERSLPFASSDVGVKALDHCSRSGDEIFTASKSSKYGKDKEINFEGRTPVSDEVKFGDNYAGNEEDIFKDLDGDKFLNSEDHQILCEMTDDTGEATLQWFPNEDGAFPGQTELESQKVNAAENGSALPLEPFHEKGEVTKDDAPAEGKADDHQITSEEFLEDISVSDTVCVLPNMLLTDTETENITEERNQGCDSIEKVDDISLNAENGFLDFDAESTTLKSQEKITITGNAFQYNLPSNGDSANEISTVLPADKQLLFPEHHVIENVASTKALTASDNECQRFFNELDVVVQMDSDPGKSCAASQQADCSFDNKENEATESVISSYSKSRVNNSFIEEGFAGEYTLISHKKFALAEKKGLLTPAGVAKTSFAKHLNSTVKKNNARTILIHGTPSKISQNADMKENAPSVKGERIGALTTLRPEKRGALKILPWK